MRLSVATLRRLVKGDLRIEFVRQELTRPAGSNCSGGIRGRSTCQCATRGSTRARVATTAGPGPACSCSRPALRREILIEDISPRTQGYVAT